MTENKSGSVRLERSERIFIIKLNAHLQQKLEALSEDVNMYSSGYKMENGHIVNLSLYYQYNLETLPEEISNLKFLEELRLSNCNKFQNFPESIEKLENLKSLKLIRLYNLEALPSAIYNLKNLQTLVLDYLNISEIPKEIKNLTALEELEVLNCSKITTLPEEISNIPNLRRLKVNSYYGLVSLPKNLGLCPKLEALELINCRDFEKIPKSINSLSTLKKLKLENCNNLKSLPIKSTKLNSLEEIEIQNCQKLEISDDLWTCENLKKIFIMSCPKLKHIPPSIEDLQQLEELKLSRLSNEIKEIPNEIKELKNLKILHLESLPLTHLPERFDGLVGLEELVINDLTSLETLPFGFFSLPKLKHLELTNCSKLVINPNNLTQISSLRKLTLRRINFNQLPNRILSIETLKERNLSDNIYSPSYEEKRDLIHKRWKQIYNPWRKVVLWGFHEEKNPSLVILYGRHDFIGVKIRITEDDVKKYAEEQKNENPDEIIPDIKAGTYNVLTDDVKYIGYLLLSGKKGHLQSFPNVRIIQQRSYDYTTRKHTFSVPEMYHTRDVKYRWGWRADDGQKLENFHLFNSENIISLPYFSPLNYGEIVAKLKKDNISLGNYEISDEPGKVLGLADNLQQYSNLLIEIISNQNLYLRKKYFNQLLQKTPPKELYKKILEIGSTELISGLFLELAKRKDDIISTEAKRIVRDPVLWAEERFGDGVKRCAQLYLNSLSEKRIENRADWIRKNLPNLDLHLKYRWGKKVPEGKVFPGAFYRRHSSSYRYYSYGHQSDLERAKRFEKGAFTDGITLNHIQFKNTVQEAEIYQLPKIIGKIAYYLDAPRLYYYLKGSNHAKALSYYQRYLIRILKDLAEKDGRGFMEAMKAMLTSYTPLDSTCKFPGVFHFNELLRYFVYFDFKEEPPRGWRFWRERSNWIRNDQLMRLEGRYEYRKDLWDENLDIVAFIAQRSKIDQISKACYYIFQESPNAQEFIQSIDESSLVQFSLNTFEPISEMFLEILNQKIKDQDTFNPDLMLALIESKNEKFEQIAMEFFNRTKGHFNPKNIVQFLFMDNVTQWIELLRQNILSFKPEEYCAFIIDLINNHNRFMEEEVDMDDTIKDLLTASAVKIEELATDKRAKLFEGISEVLFKEKDLPDWMARFIEELIFSIPYEELKETSTKMEIDSLSHAPSTRNNRIISILKGLKFENIPPDYEIVDILDGGTSKMVNIFITLVNEHIEELDSRLPTLLLLFESKITGFNTLAATVFGRLPERKQEDLLSLVIDSPVKRAYRFALSMIDENYAMTPLDYILQMLEHPKGEVKAYISSKIKQIFTEIKSADKDIFMYFLKSLLFLPNKYSKQKNIVYESIPSFVSLHPDKSHEIEEILMELGASNIITESERALVTLAKIKKEVELNAS